MKIRLRTLLVCSTLALALPHTPAFALDCSRTTTMMDMNECAAIENDKTEKTLNETYQRVMRTLGKRDENAAQHAKLKADLLAAQREWVKFRELDCKAVFTKYEDGAMRTLMHASCMHSHAERRIKDLEAYEKD